MHRVLLTEADVAKWREEDKTLQQEIIERQQRRGELRRKLDAAEILIGGPDVPVEDTDLFTVSNRIEPDHDAESIPATLISNLQKTGDSLKVHEIRDRLIKLGFEDRVKSQPNYHYSLVYRLTRTGKLLRRGSKYRAPPNNSPEGETEVVGTSAH